MQTILGSSGQIATELAKELNRSYTKELKLVSRNPHPINENDTLVRANLLDAQQTLDAVSGSGTVYFTAGLPADTERWEQEFPLMLGNALQASRATGARFVYFDNTYMYPQNDRVQTENTAFAPLGRKGKVRAQLANMVLAEMSRGEIPVLIARAPEFYGPGRTQSITNTLVINRLLHGKRALIPGSDSKLRSLIWTPDASRALALLGNTADAYGQTWHLPIDQDRLTYRQFVVLAQHVFGGHSKALVIPRWAFKTTGIFSPQVRELGELLPRYGSDNIFDSTGFMNRFPDFPVTSYRQGLENILQESLASARNLKG